MPVKTPGLFGPDFKHCLCALYLPLQTFHVVRFLKKYSHAIIAECMKSETSMELLYVHYLQMRGCRSVLSYCPVEIEVLYCCLYIVK